MISICTNCGKQWKISNDFIGRRITCKVCKQTFTITEISATTMQRRQRVDMARTTGHATSLLSKKQLHSVGSPLNSKTMGRVSPPFPTETATATSIHDAGLPSKNQDHWAGLKREQVPRSIGTSTATKSPVIKKVKAECPHCSKKFKVRPKLLGVKARCPVCKKPFKISAITKAPIKVSGGGLKKNNLFREAVEQPERTSKTSTRTAPHMMSDEKVSIKTKTIDTQSRTTASNDTDRSSGLMLRPDAELLSLMPIAEMKIKAGIAIWTMLTAMMIIVYDLRQAMGIYHAATAIMIALAVYGGGTFAFLNRQREWIYSDHQDKQKLRILQRMRATALKAGLAVPQIALAEDDPDVNVVTYGMSTDAAKVVVTGPFMEHVKPSDEELDAVLAHELSHIRHGDFITSTLLRFPLWSLHKILLLVQVLRWIGTQCFAIFAQIAGAFGIIGLFMILAGVVVLFYLSVTAAIVGAAIFICTLALSAFEREREYLADMYSARLLGSAKPLQSALAKLKQAGERVQKELEKRAEVAQEGAQINMNVEAPAEAFISDGFVAKALQQKPDMIKAFMRGEFFMSHPITEHRIFYLENPMERMRFFSNLWNKLVDKANKRLGAVPKASSTLKTVIVSSLLAGIPLAALGTVKPWIMYAITSTAVVAAAMILGLGAKRHQWSGEQFVAAMVLCCFLSTTIMFVLGILLLNPHSFYFPAVFVAALPITWFIGLLFAGKIASEDVGSRNEQ